jgi:hypothetical protein
MDLRPIVSLPKHWERRCNEHGERIVAGYAAGQNARSKACAVPGREPIHDKPEEQARGRMYECAFCLWAGLDPAVFLNWTDYADSGFDLIAGRTKQYRYDIKGSWSPTSTALIWPLSKNHFLNELRADLFVFVRRARERRENDELAFEHVGWISVENFREFHSIADAERRPRFEPGTKYIDQSWLGPMYALRRVLPVIVNSEAAA